MNIAFVVKRALDPEVGIAAESERVSRGARLKI
jgi:hypothetical protein